MKNSRMFKLVFAALTLLRFGGTFVTLAPQFTGTGTVLQAGTCPVPWPPVIQAAMVG